jgi:hypothetical protein
MPDKVTWIDDIEVDNPQNHPNATRKVPSKTSERYRRAKQPAILATIVILRTLKFRDTFRIAGEMNHLAWERYADQKKLEHLCKFK